MCGVKQRRCYLLPVPPPTSHVSLSPSPFPRLLLLLHSPPRYAARSPRDRTPTRLPSRHAPRALLFLGTLRRANGGREVLIGGASVFVCVYVSFIRGEVVYLSNHACLEHIDLSRHGRRTSRRMGGSRDLGEGPVEGRRNFRPCGRQWRPGAHGAPPPGQGALRCRVKRRTARKRRQDAAASRSVVLRVTHAAAVAQAAGIANGFFHPSFTQLPRLRVPLSSSHFVARFFRALWWNGVA